MAEAPPSYIQPLRDPFQLRTRTHGVSLIIGLRIDPVSCALLEDCMVHRIPSVVKSGGTLLFPNLIVFSGRYCIDRQFRVIDNLTTGFIVLLMHDGMRRHR